jgi:hypothetical protein
MPRMTDEQVRHLVSDIAIKMLVRASDPEPERVDALRAVVRMCAPEMDEFDLRDVVAKVAVGLNGMAVLVAERLGRLIEQGEATPYAGG